MLYRFPDLDTLRLAITSGAVPDVVSRAGARAAFDPAGTVRIQCDARLSAAGRLALGRLGVEIDEAATEDLPETVLCWPQLLPVQPGPHPEFSDRLPVLFELDRIDELPGVVSEMLRLGNDRQAVRWLGDGDRTRALLRVVGPPYYTLLRALERRQNGSPLRAYVEQGDRVWVELGTAHPLGRRLKLPAGKTLLLRAPREWELIEDGRFQDVYSVLEFELPDAPAVWQPVEPRQKIRVPLRLAPSDSPEPAELWVLNGTALAQIEQFVQSADEALLARLSFAIGTDHTETTVVLRARPGKSGSPVLVLDGTDYRPVLKLPNLFAPCTARLHPPLRRDVVKQLLAEDPLTIVWLEPGEQGSFRPRSLPDAAFRPLSDWVEYALDQAQQPLSEWMASLQFDFEPFICREEGDDRPRTRDPERPDDDFHPEEDVAPELEPSPPPVPVKARKAAAKKPATSQVSFQVKPNELRQKLHALEQEFRGLASPLEAGPQHRDLWLRMAQLNAALERTHDAAVCAGNALWLAGDPPPPAFWNWSPDVARFSSGQAANLGEWLDRILTEPSPPVADMNRLVALLAWSETSPAPLPELRERLGTVQQFLERNETHVGIRLLWIAWRAAFRQSQNDVLMLARARDRVLERLYHHGLSPDLDLPSFLRFSGSALSDRLRVVREHVLHLRKVIGDWYYRNNPLPDKSAPPTVAYIDLIFSWAFARIGEATASLMYQRRAETVLKDRDDVHQWLLHAYIYRIAGATKAHADTSLTEDLATTYSALEGRGRIVDQLRKYSRILEPLEGLNPFRTFFKTQVSPTQRALDSLHEVTDSGELRKQLNARLSEVGKDMEANSTILCGALILAPRLDEDFAMTVLRLVHEQLDRNMTLLNRIRLLTRAVFLLRYFDLPYQTKATFEEVKQLFSADIGTEAEREVPILVGHCLTAMRRLGLRHEIEGFLTLVGDRIPVPAAEPTGTMLDQTLVTRLSIRLRIVSGWLYLGNANEADRIVGTARRAVLNPEMHQAYRTELTCAYLGTLGDLAVESGVPQMLSFFEEFNGLRDPYTTNSHFSLSQLRVVESAILALVSDDVAVDKSGRRWLDDDEYLVRKRIHADVRNAIGTAEKP